MSDLTSIEVKDNRRHHFYIVDNEVIDDYASLIGVYGIAVYNVLCRFADRSNGTCFVSVFRIAQTLGGCGQNQVRNAVKLLKRHGLLDVKRRADKVRGNLSNLYILLDVPKRFVPPTPAEEVGLPPQREYPTPAEGDDQESLNQEDHDARPSDEDAPEVTSHHPAIQAYREAFHKYPRKNTYNHIAARVGELDTEIARWGRVCQWWLLSGYSPVNLAGMLAKYEKVRDGFEPEPPLSGIEDKRLRDRQQSAPRPRVRGKASKDQDIEVYDPLTGTVTRRSK